MEADRAAADRLGGDKITSVEMDWPHLEENRRACGQGSPRMEPTGGSAREGDPDTIGDALGCSNLGREDSRVERQKLLPKIELGGEH